MRAFFLATLALAASCDFGLAEVQTIDNSCGTDADCVQGSCTGGICIDDSGASVAVAIEVLQSPAALQRNAPASWAFAPEPFSGALARDLPLPTTREVRGLVRWDGEPVPASVRFVRRMEDDVAPLNAPPVEVDTLREAADGEGLGPYDFSAILVAGATYDVTVMPTTDIVAAANQAAAPAIRSLPPLYFELEVTDESTSEPQRFDVAFPSTLVLPCNSDLDRGCTLSGQVLSVQDALQIAEPGLQVRAIDALAGRVVSSIAETDELGRFSIRLNEQSSRYLIRVTSTPGRESFPAVSVDPEVAFPDELAPKRIFIPRLDPVQYTGRVRDRLLRAVPGAVVRLSSTGIFGGAELGLEGSFTASGTTDSEGVFGMELLPGLYSVTVTPPEDADNEWAVFTTESLVGGQIAGIEVIVPTQVGLRGAILTPSDEAAAGVPVLVGARPRDNVAAAHRSQETVSDVLGVFEMSIDAGRYDVQVKVPSATGFGWVIEPDLVTTGPGTAVGRTYPLEPPIAVAGSIRSSTDEPVSDALVRAYIFLESDEGLRALLVAETVSGPDGSYRLLMAPRFAAK